MMKKTCLLAALILAFSVTMLAQESSSGSQDQGTSSTTTTKSEHKSHAKSGMGKESTITGCLSGPNDEGAYVLTTKAGHKIETGGLDDLKSHVGHEVKVTGTWASGKDIGENESAEKGEKGEKGEKSEKGEKHLKATAITHVSDTCTAASATGKKKSGKSTSETSTEAPK
jgi:hypothetical protein